MILYAKREGKIEQGDRPKNKETEAGTRNLAGKAGRDIGCYFSAGPEIREGNKQTQCRKYSGNSRCLVCTGILFLRARESLHGCRKPIFVFSSRRRQTLEILRKNQRKQVEKYSPSGCEAGSEGKRLTCGTATPGAEKIAYLSPCLPASLTTLSRRPLMNGPASGAEYFLAISRASLMVAAGGISFRKRTS